MVRGITFGGHHADELGGAIRAVLGVDRGKPTMPKDDPGGHDIDRGTTFAGESAMMSVMHVRTQLWIAVVFLALTLGAGAAAADKKHDHGPRRIAIAVTKAGFSPDAIKVRKGEKLVLVVTRKTDETCAGTIVVHVSKKERIERELPLNEPVEIPVSFAKSGAIKYACGMGHVTGEIRVE